MVRGSLVKVPLMILPEADSGHDRLQAVKGTFRLLRPVNHSRLRDTCREPTPRAAVNLHR